LTEHPLNTEEERAGGQGDRPVCTSSSETLATAMQIKTANLEAIENSM